MRDMKVYNKCVYRDRFIVQEIPYDIDENTNRGFLVMQYI